VLLHNQRNVINGWTIMNVDHFVRFNVTKERDFLLDAVIDGFLASADNHVRTNA
jgi:hypothetical protein